MKTTIDIPEKELLEAMKHTKAKTKREAVVTALSDYNRRQRMAELVKYSATSDTLMRNEEIEQIDAGGSAIVGDARRGRARRLPRRLSSAKVKGGL